MASCIHRRRRIGRVGVGSDAGTFGGSWSCTTTLTFDSSDETERSPCKGACVGQVVHGASLRDTFRARSFPSNGGGMRAASSSRTGVCTLCVDGIRVLGSDGARSKRPLLLASSSSIRATLMLPSAFTSVGSLIGRLASGAFRRAEVRRGGMAQPDGENRPISCIDTDACTSTYDSMRAALCFHAALARGCGAFSCMALCNPRCQPERRNLAASCNTCIDTIPFFLYPVTLC